MALPVTMRPCWRGIDTDGDGVLLISSTWILMGMELQISLKQEARTAMAMGR